MRSGRNQTLRSDTRGASAVEFAMVAPILLALIFASFELGFYMIQRVMLDHGLDTASRAVRIGALQDGDHESFKQLVCAEAGPVLLNCNRDLIVEMTPIATAANFPQSSAICVNRAEPLNPQIRFNAGRRTELVYVRACMLVDPLIPGIGLGARLDRDATGAVRIISTSAFMNEPS